MMDYSKFADENFDAKEWINNALVTHKDGSSIDQYATTLVMKLQMFIQEVSNVEEEECRKTIANLPRVVRELESMRQEAMLLKDQMTLVKQDFERVEKNSTESMDTLIRLDLLKGRMEAASKALKESDKWSSLVLNVEDVFDSNDWKTMAEKIIAMQLSLEVLTGVPDYNDRVSFLSALKDRFAEAVASDLTAAFSSRSLEQLQPLVTIFNQINRQSALEDHYCRCLQFALRETWAQLASSVPGSIVMLLSSFYDAVLDRFQTEKWCERVFGAERHSLLLVSIAKASLEQLDPPAVLCIERHVGGLSDCKKRIDDLIDIEQDCAQFVSQVKNHVGSDCEAITALKQGVYAPLRVFTHRFEQLALDSLRQSLGQIRLDHSDPVVSIQLVSGACTKVFIMLEEVVKQCRCLTHHGCLPSLLAAFQTFIQEFISEVKRVAVNVNEKNRSAATEGSLEDEWIYCQLSLRLCALLGDILNRIAQLDEFLSADVGEQFASYLENQSEKSDSRFISEMSVYNGDPVRVAKLLGLLQRISSTPDSKLLEECERPVTALSPRLHKFAFELMMRPVEELLNDLPSWTVWRSETTGAALTADLPQFGLSPQEYITRLGQYLMTIPQHLEPMLAPNVASSALAAIRFSNLPYCVIKDSADNVTDVWLQCICEASLHLYGDTVLRIESLSKSATKQLICDLQYLTNVVDDLGLVIPADYTSLTDLLSIPPEAFKDVVDKYPAKIVNAVSLMRDISV